MIADRFTRKVALVTGAASGIGRATALALAREGAKVYVADVNTGAAAAVAQECGGGALSVNLDVCSVTDFDRVFQVIEDTDGKLDVLVNNAGAGGTPSRLEDMDFGAWDATMALLLRSVAIGTKKAVPLMRKAGGGAIVNTASVASFDAGRSALCYAVAKAGVLQLTKVSAAELARYNIRVNAVAPGLILTGIYTAWIEKNEEVSARHPGIAAEIDDYMADIAPQSQPIAKPGLPEDVAASILHLASDASAFITGTHLLIDGGLLVGPKHSWDPQATRPADHPVNKVFQP